MFTCCTYVRNNSPSARRLVCIKMEIIVLMPNVPVPPPPTLFIEFTQITASNERRKKSLIRFLLKTSKLNPVLCLGTPQAGLGEEGDRGDTLGCPQAVTRDGSGAAAAPGRGRGAPGAPGFLGSRFGGCPGDGAVLLWPLPPLLSLTSQSV